jgi:phage-related holin
MMKILLLWVVMVMKVGVRFMFGQVHNTLGILVVSILSLEASVD